MRLLLCFFLFLLVGSFAFGQAKDSVLIQKGPASFYGKKFHLKKTSNGEVFHIDSLTAAHKFLPYDTWVKVTRVDTKDFVWVRINDRLPKSSRRVIDISRGAATQLKMIDKGVATVSVKVATIDEMNRLYAHFEGDAPGTIRLRIYEKPFSLPRPEPSWTWEVGRNSITN
jgi:rare lipoprotein A